MRSRLFFACIFILFTISFLHEAMAVGIGDSTGGLNYIVDFQPGLQKTFSYFMVANAAVIMNYDITVDGNLAQYFTLSNNLFENVWPGQTRSFTATLKLPEEKPLPGLHENRICVVESQDRGGGGVVVRTKACSIINIRALYPEKFVAMDEFAVPNVDVGDILEINIGVKSWTESDINSVKATVDLYGPTEKGFNKKIATISTEEKSLASNEKITLHASIDTRNFESGEYKAVAIVYYDGNDINDSAVFKVGVLAVKVVNYTKEFVRNKINRFDVEIQSRWNSPIENVYASVLLENETLTTPAVKLQPWNTAILTTYWDTADKKAQYYDGKITLYFAGNSTEEGIRVKLLINPEEIKRIVMYAAVTTLIVMLIIIIVIMALRKPEKKKHGKTKRQ